jgi:uncharacterized protein with NAD-binding domain and iron-sulfur cluster
MEVPKAEQPRRKKIVVLGGGMASLSAAYQLTSAPGWNDDFEVTVYQVGWRLGGKGASGRNPDAENRIEEHGLHIWPGFYDNAFSMMRSCYTELARPAGEPLATWQEAFIPQNDIVIEEWINGRWIHWPHHAAPNNLLPGDGGKPPSPWEYVRKGLQWMLDHFEGSPYTDSGALSAPGKSLPDEAWREIHRMLSTTLGGTIVASPPHYLRYAQRMAAALPSDTRQHLDLGHETLIWLLDRFMKWLASSLGDRIDRDDQARRLWILLEYGWVNIKGALRDGVVFHGFDVIDGSDYRAWMRSHGASRLTLDSALIQSLYDFLFAYEGGDPARPSFAAGAALRLALRTGFGYRGSIMWKLRAGMGDTIVAPVYEVLKRRGVQFKFFHRVRQLVPSADGGSVATITLGRQATVQAGEYSPLIQINGLACWPNAPLYDQLLEGVRLKQDGIDLESSWSPWPDVEQVTLSAGVEFDLIVLGTSLATLPVICPALVAVRPEWQKMVNDIQTIQTLGVQVWLKPAVEKMGWIGPSPMLTGYADPLQTWADMTKTLEWEGWQPARRPGSVAYFCGPMTDATVIPGPTAYGFPKQEHDRVRGVAQVWFRDEAGHLWPDATSTEAPKGLDWRLLVDFGGASEQGVFDRQFFKANIEPTDRYVLSLAGSTQSRLRGHASGFTNLYLVGDWTRTGLNVGCVEAAVMSGIRVARAITGDQQLIPGESDF